MSGFEKFNKDLPSKWGFIVREQVKQIVAKNINMFLKFGIILK